MVMEMDYIDRLINVRIDKDLTQKEVANVISKSQQGYDHIEKRRAKLTIEDFIKLCDFYNINPLYFLGYENDIYPLKQQNRIDLFDAVDFFSSYFTSKLSPVISAG